MCCRIILDRRVLDWVVGLDSEINELVEGSDLYGIVTALTSHSRSRSSTIIFFILIFILFLSFLTLLF